MTDYEVMELGALEDWSAGTGKQFVEKEVSTRYVGASANALAPGGDAPFWHSHSAVEELYVFLTGRGRMALGDDVVEVRPGTVVRVAADVMRAWHADADSTDDLRWLCVRAGGDELAAIGRDGELDKERPFPWNG